MKRLLTSLLALIMVSAMAVGFTGCGEDADDAREVTNKEDGLVPVYLLTSATVCDEGILIAVENTYDDSFNLIENKVFDKSSGLTYYRYVYTYNDNQTVKKIEHYGGNDKPEVKSYDEYGNLLEWTFYNGKGDVRWAYTYDSKGRRITKTGYFNNAEISRSNYTYIYDDNGNLLRESEYRLEEEISYVAYIYDIAGNVIELRKLEENSIEWQEIYTYDADGNLIEKATYYVDAIDNKTTYTYDAEGKLVEKLSYQDGQWSSKCEYFYDLEDNLVAEVYFRKDENEEYRRNDYTYDAEGNLIGIISYEAGVEKQSSTCNYLVVRVTPEVAERLKIQQENATS